MLRLNPNDYDYLWTDYDVNFIFTSCYLFKDFKQHDILLLYDWKNKGLKFYLSKVDRVNCSKYGVEFYEKHFNSWKTSILKNIDLGKNLIQDTHGHKQKLSLMNNHELKSLFLERVTLFQNLGSNYFYTEFFFLDEVEKLIRNNPQNYRTINANLQKIGVIKFEARKILNQFYNYKQIFESYILEISKRTKRNDLDWLSYEEVISLLNGNQVTVSEREKNYWLLSKRNNWNLILGEEVHDLMKLFDNHFFKKNLNALKGISANKGIYQGRVKIIRTLFSDKIQEEIKKVNKGDIIVAETTGPEMMVALEKAGAIVTDEGGITSHAAIVSRELDIPCIVGAKIATKVLKDGDLIELDANQGIIKKLQ